MKDKTEFIKALKESHLEKIKKTEQLTIPVVVESYCDNCGCPCDSDICDDCDSSLCGDDDYEDDEPDYSDFDCTCGAWKWSEEAGRLICLADCCCGSREPWG